jgi:hypothetical protein
MTEGAGQAIDPSGEAHTVLQSAVADYGARVLSNAAIIDGICEDRLPDWPREASLVSMAARADVAAMLQQRAGGVGADTAVRLTAANLAESRSLDPAAAIWVVSEFARVLGYQVSEGLQPAAGPGGPAAAGAPPAPGGYPPASPPGEALTVPPGTPPAHPPTQRAGYPETVTTGPGGPAYPPPGSPGYAAPVSPGYPPAGGAGTGTPGGAGNAAPADAGAPPAGPGVAPPGAQGYPPPGAQGYPAAGAPGYPAAGGQGYPAPGGPPPARRSAGRGLLIGGGILGLVILYVIIAGTAHLPPFSKASPKPTGTSHSHSPSPSSSASTFQPTAADATLAALIPADVSAGGSCAPVHHPHFGSTAEYHCSGAPNVPTGYVQYYLFGSKSAMNAAYAAFLSNFAHVSRDSGPCFQTHGLAAFNSFGPCETQYSFGNTAEGRVAEYFYKGSPDISDTFTKDLILVDMQGSDGNTLIKWWDHSPNWLKD